jgi:hypothetical protein
VSWLFTYTPNCKPQTSTTSLHHSSICLVLRASIGQNGPHLWNIRDRSKHQHNIQVHNYIFSLAQSRIYRLGCENVMYLASLLWPTGITQFWDLVIFLSQSCSPDLTIPDFLLWGYLKSKVHATCPTLPKNWKTALQRELEQVMMIYCSKLRKTSDIKYSNVSYAMEVIWNKQGMDTKLQSLC